MTSTTLTPPSRFPLSYLRRLPLPYLNLLLLLFLLYKLYHLQPLTPSCTLSLRESNGLLCIPSHEWNLRKHRFVLQQLQQNTTQLDNQQTGNRFWQRNYEPNFSCDFEHRIGGGGDGGKWVCNPANVSRDKCVIYSFGSANRYGFEIGMWGWLGQGHDEWIYGGAGFPGRRPRKNCEIHTFDHTVANPTPPSFVKFHKWGLGSVDDEEKSLYTLSTIMKKLGHDKDVIVQVFKIDVEGAEYAALLPELEKVDSPFKKFRQILIELHEPRMEKDIMGRNKARKWKDVHRMFELLYKDDWVIFHKEPNILMGGRLVEYAFLKLNWGSVNMVNRFMKKNKVTYVKT